MNALKYVHYLNDQLGDIPDYRFRYATDGETESIFLASNCGNVEIPLWDTTEDYDMETGVQEALAGFLGPLADIYKFYA